MPDYAYYPHMSVSLCEDCPLKDQCGTSAMPGSVTACLRRAKHEADKAKDQE